MTGELLAEIEATLRDARQGYCRVDNRLYVTHVAALLEAWKHAEELVGIAKLNGLLVDSKNVRPNPYEEGAQQP